MAKAVASKAGDAEILDGLFRAALSRAPTEAERSRLLPILAEAVAGLTDPKEIAAARGRRSRTCTGPTLTGNEFLFNH